MCLLGNKILMQFGVVITYTIKWHVNNKKAALISKISGYGTTNAKNKQVELKHRQTFLYF